MTGPVSHVLPDGRWHFQHGPIDIIAYAQGDHAEVRRAHQVAWERFSTVLSELVAELPTLRQPVGQACALQGEIAQRMWHACRACTASTSEFITPMAAVAGSVAQALIACYNRPGIGRAWVNNGGDIALYLTEGQQVRVGLFADLARLDDTMLATGVRTDGVLEIDAGLGVAGVATSGWRGRSYSLGVADSVTVLAATAALADAAATLIANAVNVDHPHIVRRPASELKVVSDLVDFAVTVDVPLLTDEQICQALQQGLEKAHALLQNRLICASVLTCQGWFANTWSGEISRMRLYA